MGRKRIGMKRLGIDLVDIGFCEATKRYFTETRFKCRTIGDARSLYDRMMCVESTRNCGLELKEGEVYLTDFYGVSEFESMYPSLVDLAKQGKCPERLDPLATAIESDVCMVEEDVDRVAFFLGATGEEYDKMFASISTHIKEGMDS